MCEKGTFSQIQLHLNFSCICISSFFPTETEYPKEIVTNEGTYVYVHRRVGNAQVGYQGDLLHQSISKISYKLE